MTFLEGHLLHEQYRRVQEREDRRAALGAWLLANVHRDTDHRSEPFDLEDVVTWLGHGFQQPRQILSPAPPTPDELLERAQMLTRLYDGQTHNGTGHDA